MGNSGNTNMTRLIFLVTLIYLITAITTIAGDGFIHGTAPAQKEYIRWTKQNAFQSIYFKAICQEQGEG